MINYKIIQPPIGFDFQKMTKKELKDYYNWYLEILPERLSVLIKAVNSTKGYEDWKPDYSPESLDNLGQWFFNHVEIRKSTKKEIDDIYNNAPEWFQNVEIQDWDLTNRTFSLAIDIGMYLSQVFLRTYPQLKWNHYITGRKNDIDYGQPVLIKFSCDTFNPTQISVTLAYGFGDKTQTGNRLRELFDIWVKYIT